MDSETIRLVATGFFTLAASLGTAWFTTRAQTKTAREQRMLDERKWQHEHIGEIYASVHRALMELKLHTHGVVYVEMRHEAEDVVEGNRLVDAANTELSQLIFVAGDEVTEPALKALVSCRNLYRTATRRLGEGESDELTALWLAANNDYAIAMEAFKNAAAKTLRITS